MLYGSDAIAGVVDIQPPAIPLPDSFGGEVNLLGESNNNLLGLSAGLQARKEKWFYRGRLTYRDYADYNVPTNQINYESYNFDLYHNDLRNTAGQEVNASFSIGYDTENIQSETFFSNIYAKNGFFANAHGLEVRTSEIDYDRSSRDIDLPLHKVNHFKITNNTSVVSGQHAFHFDLGYQNNWREEHSEPVPHGYMPKQPDSKERAFTKNTYSLNVRDSFSPTDRHSVVAGLNTEIQENTIGGWGFLIPEYNRFTAGIFAYDQFETHSDLHLQAGVRYGYGQIDTKSYVDWYPSPVTHPDGTTSDTYVQRAQDKILNFGNISVSAGLSYINNNTTYKLNLGKSFRMPLPNELASDGVNYHMYRYEKGNLNIDPEESYQMDVGIDHATKRFNVGISPFLNLLENYIYLNPTPNYNESLQVYEYTQSRVFRAGGEVSAGATLFKNLTLNATGEYVYSRQTSGAKKGFALPFSPPFSGVLSTSYQFEKLLFLNQPEITADYRVTAPQNRIVPPEEKTSGYQVLHLSLSTNITFLQRSEPVEMRIKLNNLFNTEYYDHTSFYRLIDVPEAGRNVFVSLTIPF